MMDTRFSSAIRILIKVVWWLPFVRFRVCF